MRKLDGSVGNNGTAGVRIETAVQKRKRLIDKAYDLDLEIFFIETQVCNMVKEIQDLKPTKKELNDGVQDLIDCYGR
jgi:hypothetical protein